MTPSNKVSKLTVEVVLAKNEDGTLDMSEILNDVKRYVLSETSRIESASANMVSFCNKHPSRFITSEEMVDHIVGLEVRSRERKLRLDDPSAVYDMPFEESKALKEETLQLIHDSKDVVFKVVIGRAGGMQTLHNAATIEATRKSKKNKLVLGVFLMHK